MRMIFAVAFMCCLNVAHAVNYDLWEDVTVPVSYEMEKPELQSKFLRVYTMDNCPPCEAWKTQVWPKLQKAGWEEGVNVEFVTVTSNAPRFEWVTPDGVKSQYSGWSGIDRWNAWHKNAMRVVEDTPSDKVEIRHEISIYKTILDRAEGEERWLTNARSSTDLGTRRVFCHGGTRAFADQRQSPPPAVQSPTLSGSQRAEDSSDTCDTRRSMQKTGGLSSDDGKVEAEKQAYSNMVVREYPVTQYSGAACAQPAQSLGYSSCGGAQAVYNAPYSSGMYTYQNGSPQAMRQGPVRALFTPVRFVGRVLGGLGSCATGMCR